jgi:superfamily I DNA/RNA helicase
MDVAEHLLANNDVTSSSDYTEPNRPNKNGDKVRLLVADNPKQAYDHGYDWIAESFKRMRTTSVAVVLPFSRQLYPAQKALEQRGLTVKKAKGAGLGSFGGGVVVTTFHQLKGLEFDHVVIMGLHDAQYPGRILENMPEEDQEEEISLMRRVLYVVMTRAKQSVTLVGSAPLCRFFDGVSDELFDQI